MNKPLFFLNNKPVYKNDILYFGDGGECFEHKVHHIDADGNVWDLDEDDPNYDHYENGWVSQADLRTEKPDEIQKFGYINLFSVDEDDIIRTSTRVYDTKKLAKDGADRYIADNIIFGFTNVKHLSTNKVEWIQKNV